MHLLIHQSMHVFRSVLSYALQFAALTFDDDEDCDDVDDVAKEVDEGQMN